MLSPSAILASASDLKVPRRSLICLSLTAGDLKVQAAQQIKIKPSEILNLFEYLLSPSAILASASDLKVLTAMGRKNLAKSPAV